MLVSAEKLLALNRQAASCESPDDIGPVTAALSRIKNAGCSLVRDVEDRPVRQVTELAIGVVEVIAGIRANIGEFFDRRERARNLSDGEHRASRISTRLAFFYSVIAACLAYVAHEATPVEQPKPFPAPYSMVNAGERPLPLPTDPIDYIMEQLETIEAVEKFLKLHTSYQFVTFPAGFVKTFHRTPEEFLKAGGGPCNNFCEFVNQWASKRGMQTYSIVFKPAAITDLTHVAWHECVLFCIKRNEEYVMFDNGNCIRWRGTVEELRRKHCPEMSIYQIVPWKLTRPSFVGRLSMHAQTSVTEDEMTEYPSLIAPQTPVGPPEIVGEPHGSQSFVLAQTR
jgi:hypothetical protein